MGHAKIVEQLDINEENVPKDQEKLEPNIPKLISRKMIHLSSNYLIMKAKEIDGMDMILIDINK